jgi:CRP-like cAMP-binding protein
MATKRSAGAAERERKDVAGGARQRRRGRRKLSVARSSASPASIVAFDIVAYSKGEFHTQVDQVRGINQLVAGTIARLPPGRVLWASDGDGGNVLFLDDDWQIPVLILIRSLLRWAARADVTLRVVGHRGPLDVIDGADGRPQPVGDAINTAAHVLDVGSETGIVVSSEFRAAFGARAGVEFHEERLVRVKHGRQLELWLMSVGRRSRWSESRGVNHRMLREAVEQGRGHEALYCATRLLQLNPEDPDIDRTLAGLEPMAFRYRTPSGSERLNPILGHLDPASLRQLIDHAELIERGYGEVICRRGEVGRNMFVILRGQVGVYGTARSGRNGRGPSRVTLAEGEIVGELAFALNRRRTADVISLGDTALLSLDYRHVSRLLSDGDGPIVGVVRGFMHGRALEHISQTLPYLIGRALTALPDDLRRQWRGHLNVLQPGCQIIERPPHRPLRLSSIRDNDPRRMDGGVYILAFGRLSGHSAHEAGRMTRLNGEEFPLLYVDLPHRLVGPDREYMVDDGPAKIFFISRDAINRLPPDVRARMLQELKRALGATYQYDVFMSYNFADLAVAERWERALELAGVRVFRDTPAQPGLHYPKRDGQALIDSLVQLVLVSPSTLKAPDENWVLKEVRFRERHFDRQPRIVPVRLPEGDPRALGVMYSSIEAAGREASALEEVVNLVRAIRSGADEPPHGLDRHSSELA